ncbi:MAG TPA: pseudaminic acid cytidylyltransferase [Magnetospirillaceae bacterium]|nr:pseudaminic acid cytidylyltransferase [Magnetospirillaceae bacterium]
MSEAIAIIPARGGSKRIPGKNIKPFNGLPMIAHSIAAAKRSGLFRRIIVSTDSDEIAAIAEAHGGECPFRRPPELANDTASTAAVVLHGLDWLEAQGELPELVCCFYATAPFVTPDDLKQGFEVMDGTGCSSAFTVTSFDAPIFRAFQLTEAGTLAMIWPENEMKRSQELPVAYHDAGQFYWLDVARFRTEPRIFRADSRPVIIPRWRVQDIDTPEDWQRAELLHKMLTDQGLLR